jgi:hypothetical protein
MIKTARRAGDGLLFDPFDDTETVIRVNDLVADRKCHESPVWSAMEAEVVPAVNQYTALSRYWTRNGEKRVFWPFCPFVGLGATWTAAELAALSC